MIEVKFYDSPYDSIEDSLLKYVVIIARYQGHWLFVKHRERSTMESPGGHREPGETIEQAARRKLYEETGARRFELFPVCIYSVQGQGHLINNKDRVFGKLYFAEVSVLGPLPPLEIERVEMLKDLPSNWTYPELGPKLLQKAVTKLSLDKG